MDSRLSFYFVDTILKYPTRFYCLTGSTLTFPFSWQSNQITMKVFFCWLSLGTHVLFKLLALVFVFLCVQVVICLLWLTLWRLWSSLVCELVLLQGLARAKSHSTILNQKTVSCPRQKQINIYFFNEANSNSFLCDRVFRCWQNSWCPILPRNGHDSLSVCWTTVWAFLTWLCSSIASSTAVFWSLALLGKSNSPLTRPRLFI